MDENNKDRVFLFVIILLLLGGFISSSYNNMNLRAEMVELRKENVDLQGSYREFQYFEYYEADYPSDELTSCELLCKHYNKTGSVDYDPDKKVLACSCTR